MTRISAEQAKVSVVSPEAKLRAELSDYMVNSAQLNGRSANNNNNRD